jgi:hypothetical protein
MFFEEFKKKDETYSRNIKPPQYLPKNEKPNIEQLVDIRKYRELMANISRSNLPEDEKDFLKLAATRHIVFNYSKIADYYAHSEKEMQELMEQSALVIIDINDAIANGYVKLSKNIEKIMRETGKDVKSKE